MFGDDEVTVCAAPLFHIAGLGGLAPMLLVGGCTVEAVEALAAGAWAGAGGVGNGAAPIAAAPPAAGPDHAGD